MPISDACLECLTNLGYLPKALTRKKQESKTETTDRAPPKDTERTATAISATSSNSSPYVEANSARPLAAVVERVKKFDFGSALALGPTDCLRDQGFVVTGGFGGSCSVNDIMILIRTHGGYTLDQPCKLTQYLVAGDNPSATEAQAAESFGMKTITQQDLFEGIGNCCAKRSSRESSTEELPRLDQSQSTTEDLTSKAPAIAEKRPAPESPAAPAPTSKRRRLEDTEGCFRLSSTRTHSDNSSRPTKRTTRAGSTNPHLTPPNSESPLQDISKPVPTARSKVVVLPVGGRTKNKTSRLQTQQVQEIVNRPVLQPLKTETGSEVIDLTEKDDESPERNSEARHGSSPLAVEHAAGEPDTSRERASESPESTGQAGTSVYFSEIEELQKKHLLTLRRVDNLEFKLAAAVADDPDEEELELQRVELKLKIKKMQRAKGRAGTELK